MAALAGYDGRRELVPEERADPYDDSRLTVIANVRESPLALLWHRGMISDGEHAAGERFRRLYEASVIGGARAIDYRRPKVDGGKLGDPLTSSGEAALALKAISEAVGSIDYRLLSAIVGEGRSIGEVVGVSASIRARLHVGWRVRDALHVLAVRWGYERDDGRIVA